MKVFTSNLALCYCLTIPVMSVAEENKVFDADQPVSLKSKHISMNQKNGNIIYTGNVRLKQGSLSINSAIARTKTIGNQPAHVWAKGNPVHVETTRNGKVIELTAAKAHYDVQSGVITLTDNVQVKMGNDKVDSNKILYNVKSNTIIINSDDAPVNATFDPAHIKGPEKNKK